MRITAAWRRCMRGLLLLWLLGAGTVHALAHAGGHARQTVDINRADVAALDSVLHNIGPAKARAIVAHRDEYGPFKSAEELALVPGIGLKTVERNIDRIQLGPASGASAPPSSAGQERGPEEGCPPSRACAARSSGCDE